MAQRQGRTRESGASFHAEHNPSGSRAPPVSLGEARPGVRGSGFSAVSSNAGGGGEAVAEPVLRHFTPGAVRTAGRGRPGTPARPGPATPAPTAHLHLCSSKMQHSQRACASPPPAPRDSYL